MKSVEEKAIEFAREHYKKPELFVNHSISESTFDYEIQLAFIEGYNKCKEEYESTRNTSSI